MVERLKQIWGGFEKETTRHLTNRGVDNIQVPPRRDWRAESENAPTNAAAAPATAAFEALKSRLAAKGKKAAKRDGGESEAKFVAESEAARDLIRGLKATEARIVRSDRLYSGEGAQKRGLLGGKRETREKKGFRLF
jgi:hypothetical protein